MTQPPKFAVHGGYVVSQHDGDRHFISAYDLVRLYELKPGEYLIWDGRPGRSPDNYRHLYPRSDGRYGRPRE